AGIQAEFPARQRFERGGHEAVVVGHGEADGLGAEIERHQRSALRQQRRQVFDSEDGRGHGAGVAWARPGRNFALAGGIGRGSTTRRTMNTANLQLEGLYAAMAALMNAIRDKGVLSADEIETVLKDAETLNAESGR